MDTLEQVKEWKDKAEKLDWIELKIDRLRESDLSEEVEQVLFEILLIISGRDK